MVGAVAIVLLTACSPQDQLNFLLGLPLWGGACGLLATLLRNFAAYSAALAGYTALIIASDEFGATGGTNGDAFMLAITRTSEICIGIVCSGLILARTDFGGARRGPVRRACRLNHSKTCLYAFTCRMGTVGNAPASARAPATSRCGPSPRQLTLTILL